MNIITRDGFVISLISAQLLIVMIFFPRTVVLGNYFTGFNSLKMGVAYYSTFSWMIVLNDIAEICIAIPQTINMNDQAIMHNTLCRSYVCSALTTVVCSHFQIPTQTTLIPPPPKASTTPWILTACWWRPSAAWEGNKFSGPPIPHCCSLPLLLLHGQQPQGDDQKVLHSKPWSILKKKKKNYRLMSLKMNITKMKFTWTKLLKSWEVTLWERRRTFRTWCKRRKKTKRHILLFSFEHDNTHDSSGVCSARLALSLVVLISPSNVAFGWSVTWRAGTSVRIWGDSQGNIYHLHFSREM